jgi:D-sedoheptulose 7-phosphate isomerase
MVKKIIENINTSINLKKQILDDSYFEEKLYEICKEIIECYNNGNKILFCGNGGSFADAQHLSAELSGRFYFDRPPLEVVLLSSNSSYLTAVANDYSYEDIFTREFKSSAKKGDLLISFSTSGKSKNIIELLNLSKNYGVKSISFLGNDGGIAKDISDFSIIIPSNDTARIQECHMLLGHSIIEVVEHKLFNKLKK